MPDHEITGIEVKIGKLETKVDYVISEIKDLKTNLAGRLDKTEMRIETLASTKLLASDFIDFKTKEFSSLSKDVYALKIWKIKIMAYASVVAFLSGIFGNILYNVIANVISSHIR